ncbi:MAG: pyridoxal phosphate-dependent aminotransferase [Pyrinomonadaceae bacterium]|nr:pyridoxal phosphate-dependent aminotransferase [Pyrinomonadaceae bacterium]MCX7640269.1 pyridoxal phosphate-dependent aminotransferase [Pyrinomonadaceae bacterium]MDW8305283.1 pyridoxal phosphate-dependent aminotransferase [Acidobacteriota bacterium]
MKAVEGYFKSPRRLQGVQTTLIRQIFERALPGSINFGLGEPDLPTPDFLRREAARIALEEQNGYTSHAGLLALREKVADVYSYLNLTPNHVCITVGSQEAMTATFLAVIEDGDEVLIPNPSFPAYENCVRLAGGVPVFYRMPKEDGFVFDLEEFKSKITPKTKAAVIISPSNPTGRVLTENDLKEIANVLDGTGIYLISDEIYADLYFTDRKPPSASMFYDRTLIVSGLSKSLSMTGWRVGWLASSQLEVVKAALVVHGFLTVCTSTISQKAALLAWSEEAERAKKEARETYKKRGEFLTNLIEEELGIKCTKPEGAFYTMADVRDLGDDLEIAEKFLQNRVITVPGIAFGSEAKGFLRISFCNDYEQMREGVRRMKEVLNAL